jgi:hypothetical protein
MKLSRLTGMMVVGLTAGLMGCGGGAASSAGGTNTAKAPVAKKKPSKQKGDKPLEVPAEWEEWRDEVKKYGFSLPKGTKTSQKTSDGVEFLEAMLPAPHKVDALAAVWRDKTLSKDDLFGEAKGLLETLGSSGVVYAGCEDLDNVFRVCDVEFTTNGEKAKGGVLVGTDVSDNYIMIAATPEADFEKNLPTIGSLLGSYFLFD